MSSTTNVLAIAATAIALAASKPNVDEMRKINPYLINSQKFADVLDKRSADEQTEAVVAEMMGLGSARNFILFNVSTSIYPNVGNIFCVWAVKSGVCIFLAGSSNG